MKKKIIATIEILAAVAFYVFLYKVASEHFQQLKELDQITDYNNFEYKYLFITLFLVVPNWLLEAVKWRSAIMPIEPITLRTAVKGVLKGIPPSTFTPNRVGETIGRPSVLTPGNRISGAIATAYCGISQMPVMLIFAAAGSAWLMLNGVDYGNIDFVATPYIICIATICAVLASILFYHPQWLVRLLKNKRRFLKILQKLEFFTKYDLQTKHTIIALSAARYMVYSTQNLLLILAAGINIGVADGLAVVFLTYGIISFVPRPALAELGVRCSVAVLLLQPYTNNIVLPAAASAALWIINILIPCIVGTFFYLKRKKTQKNFAQ